MYKSKVNIMANKDLFKQAIADAKSIREAAIANAKLALEESLTPQLKELLAQRLTEMEEEDAPATVISEEEVAEEAQEETLEEAIGAEGEHSEEGEVEGDEAGEEAEVDSEESEDEAEEEVGEMSVEDLKDLIRDVLMQVMGDQEQGEEDELEADAMDMTGDDMTAVTDTEINIDELMAELATLNNPGDHGNLPGAILEVEEVEDPLMEAAIKQVMGGLKETTHKYLRTMAEARGCSMEELVKEATKMGALAEMSKVSKLLNDIAELGEAPFTETINKLIPEKTYEGDYSMEENIMAEDIMSKIKGMSEDMLMKLFGVKTVGELMSAIANANPINEDIMNKIKGMSQDMLMKLFGVKSVGELMSAIANANPINKEVVDTELSEALSIIETLRNDLNETNLLNAKLLYVNKVFKASNLSESQKASVIAAFDKAETVKEVKLVYETVSENVSSVGKKEVVREAKGFASAAAGISTKPGVITETNQAVLRMQKLAGIIK